MLDNTSITTVVYTDEHRSYAGMMRLHQTIKHSARKYVDGSVTTNRIESFWALMKRAYKGRVSLLEQEASSEVRPRVRLSTQSQIVRLAQSDVEDAQSFRERETDSRNPNFVNIAVHRSRRLSRSISRLASASYCR